MEYQLKQLEFNEMPKAVTAQHPAEETSKRYSFIPTTNVIEALGQEGWVPVKALSSKPVTKDPLFVKHAVEFEHPDISALTNDERFRITVYNSHDGSSSFRFYTGLLRIVCSNGLTTGKSFNTFNVRHIGYTADKVKDALYHTLQQAPKLAAVVDAMKSLKLNSDDRYHLYDKVTQGLQLNLWANDTSKLEQARRYEDRSNDLWTVFNRVQEHIIRGGLLGTSINKDGFASPRRLKAVKSVQRQLEVNRMLWDIAESTLNMKGAL